MADESPVAPLIWNELVNRYKELVEVNERFATHVRCAVVGELGSAPEQLAGALFGDPAATALHQAEAGAWQVAATFSLDDVPGDGVIGGSGSEETALAYLREADFIVLGTIYHRLPTDIERGIYSHLRRLGKTRLVVAVGRDEPVPDSETDAWAGWKLELSRWLTDGDLTALPLREHADEHLIAIAKLAHEKLDKRFRLSLIAKLKHAPSRDALVHKLIHELARVAGFLGLNPIPFADVIAITPVQVLLVCRVAAAFGHKVTVSWARDFLATCGVVSVAGMGFRQVFRTIVRGLGNPAVQVKMAIGGVVAFMGTEAIGHAARIYFAADGRLTVREAFDRAKATHGEWSESSEFVAEVEAEAERSDGADE